MNSRKTKEKKIDFLKIKNQNQNKNQTSKHLRSWNLHSKPYSIMRFWASLSMIRFEDLNLILCVWVFSTPIKVIIERNPILTTLCYYFQAFDQKRYGFSISKHYFGPLYHACTWISKRHVIKTNWTMSSKYDNHSRLNSQHKCGEGGTYMVI